MLPKVQEDQKVSFWQALGFLCFSEYLLYKSTNTYYINSCETIEVFYKLRTDLDKLKYASFITKIIIDVATENENCYEIMQLLLNTLYTISETEKNKDLVLAIFKFRLLSILGYTPNISDCKVCRQKENILYFSIKEDGFKCGVCAKQDKSALQMSDATKKAIQYAILAPAKKLYSFNIPDKYIKELEIISKLYFNNKLEKEYKLEDIL